jgi:hypothetical protein
MASLISSSIGNAVESLTYGVKAATNLPKKQCRYIARAIPVATFTTLFPLPTIVAGIPVIAGKLVTQSRSFEKNVFSPYVRGLGLGSTILAGKFLFSLAETQSPLYGAALLASALAAQQFFWLKLLD